MSTGAFAQSNVQIYGVFDIGVQRSNNGQTSLSTESVNGHAGNRLGFTGTEDLGAGLKATFLIEHGFLPDTGAQADAARFWNRRSFVSLGGNWGEVRFGRDYLPTYLQWLFLDPFGTAGVGAINNLLPRFSNQATTLRADNGVMYVLPTIGGLSGEFMVTANESGTPTGNKYAGGRLGYTLGNLFVTGAYGETDVIPVGNGSKVKETFLGGSYDFKVAKLSLNLSKRTLGDNDRRHVHLGALVPVTAADTIRFTYAKYKNNSPAADDAKLLAVGLVHTLSKRTLIYSTYARINNDLAGTLATGSLAAVAGRASSAYEIGIRHNF